VAAGALPGIAGGAGLPAGRVAVVSYSMAQAPAGTPANVVWHAAPADARGYARELYALLRRLDAEGYDLLLLEDLPGTEAWRAVRDRVGRAAAALEAGR